MSDKVILTEDQMQHLLKESFHDHYLLIRERKIQETITGDLSFHQKSIEQAIKEINDAIANHAWDKLP